MSQPPASITGSATAANSASSASSAKLGDNLCGSCAQHCDAIGGSGASCGEGAAKGKTCLEDGEIGSGRARPAWQCLGVQGRVHVLLLLLLLRVK
eukprot:CAMPEP_0172697046 /NCGR_PEP_ID=MMETSP1074-20121228/28476_1 /TAXON_ID=2916 /ORGANISM="Ceratium fusus, Strain PA161109" /LENGTH=94 /DNA_ID=CAMNT_0013517879 /DNA_START=89 /DNA_END=373 /DNA_ORIENTATION=+